MCSTALSEGSQYSREGLEYQNEVRYCISITKLQTQRRKVVLIRTKNPACRSPERKKKKALDNMASDGTGAICILLVHGLSL